MVQKTKCAIKAILFTGLLVASVCQAGRYEMGQGWQSHTNTVKSKGIEKVKAPSLQQTQWRASDYVYETSPDLHGQFPWTLPPLLQSKDMLQWYKDMVQFGAPAGELAEPGIPGYEVIGELAMAGIQLQQNASPLPPVFQSNGPAFDVNEFAARIVEKMDDEALGYSYVINHKKQHAHSDGRGMARNDTDTYLAQSEYKRMNIASISKTITAVAVLQLLEMNGLSVHDPVGPWLPSDWTRSYGFDNPQTLSFYDLLTHRSGIKQTVQQINLFDEEFAALDLVTWNGLKAVVGYGIDPYHHGDPLYTNVNYALFRVIIPALWEAAGQPVGDLDANSAAAFYQAYIAENIFLPIDIHQPSCAPPVGDDSQTRYYNVFEPQGTGGVAGNWTLKCGSGGWYLSAYELAAFMAYLRYSERILSPEMRELMDALMLGWSESWSFSGDHGQYRAHAGALYFDAEDFPDRREMQGCIMKFPIQVEAVLLVNSSVESNKLPCTVLGEAFDAAWAY